AVTSGGAITAPTSSNTINGIVINSQAISNVSTLNLSGAITGATATNTINGAIINGSTQTFAANSITDTGALSIATGGNGNLTLTPNGTGQTIISSDSDSGVYIGSTGNTPAVLSVNGGIGSNAAFNVNNVNSGDLITASSSGVTKFTVAGNGDLTATGTVSVGQGGTGLTTFGGANTLLYTTTADNLASVTNGTTGQYLRATTGGAPAFATITSGEITNTDFLVKVPGTTAANTIAPTAASVVALTVKGTNNAS